MTCNLDISAFDDHWQLTMANWMAIEWQLVNWKPWYSSSRWPLTLPATGSTSTPLSSRWRKFSFFTSSNPSSSDPHLHERKPLPSSSDPLNLNYKGATSHKFVDPTGNYWMHLYYTDRQIPKTDSIGTRFIFHVFQTIYFFRKVLFSMCAGNELFYARCLFPYWHFEQWNNQP